MSVQTDQQTPPASAVVASVPAAAPATDAPPAAPVNDSPYLADGDTPAPDDAGAPAPVAPAGITVAIEGFDFAPSGPVTAGSPIAVTNLDSADHTLTADDGTFDTGTIGQDQLVTIAAPATPGTYEFFCVIHPSMTGQLVVS